MNAQSLVGAQKCLGGFQSPLVTYPSLDLPFRFHLLFTLTGMAPSGSCNDKQLPLIVFYKCPGGRIFLVE